MKVEIGNYPNRWRCRIHDNYMNKKYGYDGWPIEYSKFEQILEKLEDCVQWVYNHTVNLYCDNAKQTVKVHIDPWDTWSMDHTLAPIIVPMLKQLKESKHGAPNVDLEDVPENLRPTEEDIENYAQDGATDTKFFARWDWVMDEMIWSFEQKCRDNWEEDYYKYEDDPTNTEGLGLGIKLVWENREGQQAHQERMNNGFRLFGKYYEALWD